MSHRILIVDDNAANLKLARVLLVSEGYEVRTAIDAEEALLALREFRPALILMDIQLPGMDGLALARRLKADPATRPIAIVAMTAYAMKGDEEKALAAGCDGYVTKPIDTRTLPATLARYLGREDLPGREGAGAAEPDETDEPDEDPGTAISPSRRRRLLELARRDGEGFLAEVVTLFCGGAADALVRLRGGAAGGDRDTVEAAAHKLGGSAANVGASRLARLCGELSSASGDELPGLVERVATELDRVEGELREIASEA